MIWVALCSALATIAIWPFLRERLRPPMDETARRTAPGQGIALPSGLTHYEWIGSARGPVALCIHGLTTPSFVWKGIALALAAMGYRVLIYDLYGRGYSDRPPGRQTRAFFLRQLNELLAAQDLGQDLTIIGYSMGGAIATAFAAAHPDRVRQLVLLAPAGIRVRQPTRLEQMLKWPLIGDWLMLMFYPGQHLRGIAAERGLPSSVPDIHDRQKAELRFRGFVPAVLSSYRGLLSETFKADHIQIAQHNIPTLAVFGGADPLVPPSAAGPLIEWHRRARVEVIAGAGHGLPYTHTDAVMHHVTDFLRDRGKLNLRP